MGEGYIVRRGGVGGGLGFPEYTYNGGDGSFIEIRNETNKYWELKLLSSGGLTFTKLGNASGGVDVFLLGGGGAGANMGSTAVGGGGYYTTLNARNLAKGVTYQATIGAGAENIGSAGGSSSFLEETVQGGGAGEAPESGTASCTVTGSPAGNNVYSYTSKSDTNRTIVGNGTVTLTLLYPLQTEKHTQTGYIIYRGVGAWYLCNTPTVNKIYYTASSDGIGADQTQIFDTGDIVSGPGEINDASRRGQGGGTNGVKGGDGIIVIRPAAARITTQPADIAVAVDANAKFSITAAGRKLTYQWQFLPTDTDAQWSNTTATGATTSQLTIQALSYRNGYKYRCIVSDGYNNQVISDEATLTISA